MKSELLLEKMNKDLELLKEKISKMEENIEELHEDLHEVKPEYIEKLRKIEKDGKFNKYSSIKDLRRKIENV